MPPVDLETVRRVLREEIDDALHPVRETLEKHGLTLYGNGDPTKGLVVKTDRLEQAESRRKWLVGAAVTASIGAIANGLRQLIAGH